MIINAMELVFELRQLADKFSEGWHDGIKIDASDIMLLSQAASFIEAIVEAKKQESDELTIAYMSGLYDGKKKPKREWVGLTDEDYFQEDGTEEFEEGAMWAEAKLQERNT